MYTQRKNFLSYEVPSADAKKAEAKRILSSMFEAMSVDELNALYQPSEAADKSTRPMQPVQMNNPVPVDDLLPVSDTLITVGKLPMEDDQVVVDVKKPIKVVFRDSTELENTSPMAVTEDSTYDCLDAAPPLDLTADLTDTIVSRGQGMTGSVQVTPGVHRQHNTLPTGDIKSVEEDIEGYSVVGLDNAIGMDMLK